MDWNKFSAVKEYCNDTKQMHTCSKLSHRAGIRPTCLEWNCTGEYLVLTADHYVSYVYRFDSDKSFKDPNAHFVLEHTKNGRPIDCTITAANWHPTRPSVLCTISEDHHVYLWDLTKATKPSGKGMMPSLKPFHLIKTAAPLRGISWSHDGSKICILDRDSTLTLVDGEQYTENRSIRNRNKESPHSTSSKILCFVWSRDDRYIVAATKDGTVRIFEVSSLSKVHEFEVHNGGCFCINISGDCKWIATGGADSMVNVFDLNHLLQQYAFNAGDTAVNAVGFNFNSKLIASCSNDKLVKIGYIGGGHQVQKCIDLKTQSPVHVMKWNPKRNWLAYSGIPDYNDPNMVHLNAAAVNANSGGRPMFTVNIWGHLKN